MPKVSVIVPVYGVEHLIERCARSLFDQTLDSIEYLFIDDCSPDRSIDVLRSVLEEYGHRKHQVIIHRMEQNSGQAKVREWGMKNATGDYVIHCDSDDWVDTNMYQDMYEKAVEQQADIVICDYYVSDGITKKKVSGCYFSNQCALIKDILTERISRSVWNKLVKRSLYEDIGIQYPVNNMGEDMVLILQALLKTEKIAYVSNPYYYYFLNPKSITHQVSLESTYSIYQQLACNTALVLNCFNTNGQYEQYKKELLYLKWCLRRSIWAITYRNQYLILWKSTYPEIIPGIFFTTYLSLPDKLKIILTYIRLYPIKRVSI